jgi:hypothetical protein
VLEITAKAQAVQELTVSADDTPVTQIEVGPTVTTQALTLPPFSGDLIKLTLSSERSAGPVTASRVALKMNE